LEGKIVTDIMGLTSGWNGFGPSASVMLLNLVSLSYEL
jgi:hypothetical protein